MADNNLYSPIVPNRLRGKKYNVIALLILSMIIFYFKSKDINLKIAYSGWGPQDYVAHKLNSENFSKDWPSGILNYDNSLIIKLYYYLAKYVKLDPSVTVFPFMFIQTFLFLWSIFFLTQTLFENKFISLISAIIISVSYLAGINLSRFGLGYASLFSFPIYYVYAAAFNFFALGFYLKNRYLLSFIFLGLAVYCHINMGFFVLAFILFYFLLRPKCILDKHFLLGLIVFAVMIAPHIFRIIKTSNMSTGGIPTKSWILMTKIFSHHWYPITMGLFTFDSYGDFFPILLLSFSFFISLRYQNLRDEKTQKVLSGIAACIIMTLLGIVFSDIIPIPFFIKISLQRSTEFITLFGVLFLIHYLAKQISDGYLIKILLSVFALMTMMLSRPGLAVLPTYLLLLFDIREGCLGPFKIHGRPKKTVELFYCLVFAICLFIAAIPLLATTFKSPVWSYIQEKLLWIPFHYFNPLREPDFLVRGGTFKFPLADQIYIFFGCCFVLFVLGAFVAKRFHRDRINAKNSPHNKKIMYSIRATIVLTTFLLSYSIVYLLNENEYASWKKGMKEISRAYLDAQLWAKSNTPRDSLFMPDPAHTYGWRDFSERSSFGNIREWAYTNLGYQPSYKQFREGLQRIREFGIDIEKITEEDLKKNRSYLRGAKFSIDIRDAYYSMPDTQLQALCAKYQINYVILDKQFIKKKYDRTIFSTAFENKYFLILKPLKETLPRVSRENKANEPHRID